MLVFAMLLGTWLFAVAAGAQVVIGVDGKAPSSTSWTIKPYKTLKVFKGVEVDFQWTQPHDVTLAANQGAWTTCSAAGSKTLAPFAPTGSYRLQTANNKVGDKLYVICAVPGHCAAGQKVLIQVVAAPACTTAKTSAKCLAIPGCAYVGGKCATAAG